MLCSSGIRANPDHAMRDPSNRDYRHYRVSDGERFIGRGRSPTLLQRRRSLIGQKLQFQREWRCIGRKFIQFQAEFDYVETTRRSSRQETIIIFVVGRLYDEAS